MIGSGIFVLRLGCVCYLCLLCLVHLACVSSLFNISHACNTTTVNFVSWERDDVKPLGSYQIEGNGWQANLLTFVYVVSRTNRYGKVANCATKVVLAVLRSARQSSGLLRMEIKADAQWDLISNSGSDSVGVVDRPDSLPPHSTPLYDNRQEVSHTLTRFWCCSARRVLFRHCST